MNSMNESLLSLTWEDLRQWAGSTIMGRGKTYIKNVSDLARTESGGLIAWVAGTEDYATNVEADEDGELDWFCSCPYDLGALQTCRGRCPGRLGTGKSREEAPSGG